MALVPWASTCTPGTHISEACTKTGGRHALSAQLAGPTHRYCRRRASTSALTLLIWDRWLFSSSRSISSRWAFFMASMAVDRMWPLVPRGLGRDQQEGGILHL